MTDFASIDFTCPDGHRFHAGGAPEIIKFALKAFMVQHAHCKPFPSIAPPKPGADWPAEPYWDEVCKRYERREMAQGLIPWRP